MNEPKAKPLLRIIDRPRLKAQIQWEPRDLWVGVFWRESDLCLHVYICLIPLLPLHIVSFRRK